MIIAGQGREGTWRASQGGWTIQISSDIAEYLV
jgi:hypothetical protein